MPTPSDQPTPATEVETETAKILKHQAEAAKLAAFMKWISDKGLVLCREYEWGYQPDPALTLEELLADYFDIDLEVAHGEESCAECGLQRKFHNSPDTHKFVEATEGPEADHG